MFNNGGSVERVKVRDNTMTNDEIIEFDLQFFRIDPVGRQLKGLAM